MKKRDGDAEVPQVDRNLVVPRPCDAVTNFNDYVDLRFRDLLGSAMEPKEFTEALKAATAWVKTKHEVEGEGEWGSKLPGRTLRDG